MTFETMDWEAEAQRVALAFGVEAKCRFVKSNLNETMTFRPTTDGQDVKVPDGSVRVYYQSKVRSYQIFASNEVNAAVRFIASGGVRTRIVPRDCPAVEPLARGLFYLNLLTSEVEASLQVAISAHQKAEWTLEYAKRLAAAE